MKLTSKKLAVGAVILLGGMGVFFFLGQRAETQTAEIFKQSGLTPLELKPASKSLGAIVYKDIILDQDSISTIKTVQASYGMNGGQIFIDGLQLTGDTLRGDLSISGFNFENFPYALARLPLDTILLRNSSVSVLTDAIGGISVSYDGQALRKDDGLEYQIRFQSEQKHLAMRGQGSGVIRQNEWNMEGEIEQSRFNLPFLGIDATRANGRFTIAGTAGRSSKLSAQINAGGADVLGLPCKNLTVTVEALGEQRRIFGNTKALKNDDIEISVTGDEKTVVYTFFAPSYAALYDYFEKNGRKVFIEGAKLSKNATDVTLNITRSENQAVVSGEAQGSGGLVRFRFTADWPV